MSRFCEVAAFFFQKTRTEIENHFSFFFLPTIIELHLQDIISIWQIEIQLTFKCRMEGNNGNANGYCAICSSSSDSNNLISCIKENNVVW